MREFAHFLEKESGTLRISYAEDEEDAQMDEQRFEYEFIRLEPKVFLNKGSDYQYYINEWAKRGWRLVTIVAPPSEVDGAVGHYELIFEKPIGRPESSDTGSSQKAMSCFAG